MFVVVVLVVNQNVTFPRRQFLERMRIRSLKKNSLLLHMRIKLNYPNTDNHIINSVQNVFAELLQYLV